MANSGIFKIYAKNALFPQWAYFKWRNTKGVMEVRNRDNSFSEWTVMNKFPDGAILE